jgi:hypothetical protein
MGNPGPATPQRGAEADGQVRQRGIARPPRASRSHPRAERRNELIAKLHVAMSRCLTLVAFAFVVGWSAEVAAQEDTVPPKPAGEGQQCGGITRIPCLQGAFSAI